MNASQTYILIVVAVLGLIFVGMILFKKRKPEKMSKLISLAFICIIASIMFDSRPIGYGLIGAGIAFGLADMIIKNKKGDKDSGGLAV